MKNGLTSVLFLFYKNWTMGKPVYLTKQGHKNLKEELEDLKSRGRREISAAIGEARDKGDLSENAEYDAAKDAQGHMELKISKLETKIANAKIIEDSDEEHTEIKLLSNVVIKNVQNGKEFKYGIVPEEESDLASGKISASSPIGKGLMGKKPGDVVEIQIPAGKIEFEVISISK